MLVSIWNMDSVSFYLYGHSFVKRIYKFITRENRSSVCKYLDVPPNCNLFLDGYSGLTYDKIFASPERYLQRIQQHKVDVLFVDIGSNDLCSYSCTPVNLTDKAFQFIELLGSLNVQPKIVVFFSVIQRLQIVRPGQVSTACFLRKCKRFNRLFSQKLAHRTNMYMFSQKNINNPKYILPDGFHLSVAGSEQYCRNVKKLILKYLDVYTH